MSQSLTIRVFKHKILMDSLTESEINALTKDFKHYKETRQKPTFFGRDEAYDHPNTLPILRSEEVKHIHLAADAPFLIAILAPDAHEQARNRTIMHNLGLIAENFRQKF